MAAKARSQDSQRGVRLAIAAGVLLIAAWVAVQGWLLSAHWINPDEGAHLMDARLAMEGLVPEVHFASRQVFYVYSYVPFLSVLGPSYVSGRVMPLLATLLSAWILYLIGRRLWSRTIGMLVAFCYLLTPTVFINVSVVKTEPLAILLTALGIYGLIVHLQDRRRWPLIGAGVALGLGYYVRESTLVGLSTGAVMLLLRWRDGMGQLIKRLALLGLGYAIAVGGVLAWYLPYRPLAQFLTDENLYPLAKIGTSLRHILGWWQRAASGGEAIRQSAQSWSFTGRTLLEALRLNVHLLVGVVAAGILWAWNAVTRRRAAAEGADAMGLTLAYAWLASATVLYGYHILQRGFFQFYFRELIPPMTLLLAWGLRQALRAVSRRTVGAMAVGLVTLAAVGVSGLTSARYAEKVLDRAYDCVWSPTTVREVAQAIRDHSDPDDDVLSGGLIWEFEAGRQPFLNITHPLAFINEMPDDVARQIAQRLDTQPPAIIVMDGYTERTYAARIAQFESVLATAYRRIAQVSGSRYPVTVFRLEESGRQAMASAAATVR